MLVARNGISSAERLMRSVTGQAPSVTGIARNGGELLRYAASDRQSFRTTPRCHSVNEMLGNMLILLKKNRIRGLQRPLPTV